MPVQLRSSRGAQALRERLAEQRVGEAPSVRLAGHRIDDEGRLGVIEEREDPISLDVGGACERSDAELTAEERREGQELPALSGELSEIASDREAHAVGHLEPRRR